MKFKNHLLVLCLLFILSLSSFLVQAQAELDDDFYQKIKNPTEISEMLDYFSKLKGSWKVYETGELVQNSTINYSYLGSEVIEQAETEKISLEIINQGGSSNLMYFWIGQEEIRQMEIDGQIIPKEMAAMMTDELLKNVFSPFLFLENMDIANLREMGKTSINKEMIAGNEMNVVTIQSDNLTEMKLESGMVKLVDFDQFLIVVAFEYEALDSVEKVAFELEEIEFR